MIAASPRQRGQAGAFDVGQGADFLHYVGWHRVVEANDHHGLAAEPDAAHAPPLEGEGIERVIPPSG